MRLPVHARPPEVVMPSLHSECDIGLEDQEDQQGQRRRPHQQIQQHTVGCGAVLGVPARPYALVQEDDLCGQVRRDDIHGEQ